MLHRLLVIVLALATAGVAADDSADKFFDKVRRDNLEKLARSKKAEERARAAESLGSWDDALSVAALTHALEDPDAEVRENAARSLWKLHEVAGSAQDALRARLEDVPDVAVAAAGALEAMDVDPSELVGARRRALVRGSPWVRFVAAKGLIGHAPPAELLPPILDQYLRDAGAPFSDSDGRARRDSALEAMKELAKTQDRSLIPPLVESLRRMTPGRPGFLRVLAVFEPPPDDWRDVLIGLVSVSDAPLQSEAIDQLERLTDEVDVRAWVPAVARLLPNRGLRRDATSALGSAGALASEHAPAIASLVLKGSEDERKAAAEALGRIGDRRQPGTQAGKEQVAKAALPALQQALREDLARDVRLEAARAIDSLQIDPAVAATALAEAVARPEEDPMVRQSLLFALRNRGGEAKAAAPALEAFLPRAGSQRDLVENALESIRSGRVLEPTLAPSGAGTDKDAEVRAHSYLRAKGVAFEESQFAKALREADLQVVSAFLDAGMSVNHKFVETFSQTPLGALMRWGPCDPNARPTPDNVRETLELLLASGGDVNGADQNGITPLMDAASKGCDRVVMRTLIKAGARLGDKDKNGLTAFEFGAWSGHDGLEELIAAGYRMPAARAQELIAAYADNPKALALLRKASAPKPATARTPAR
jgi:HEAT repeat protein